MTPERVGPPPEAFAKLLRDTSLRWSFYDRSKKRPRYHAYTRFDVHVQQRHRYRFTRVKKARGEFVRVQVDFLEVRPTSTHVITAPDYFESSEALWDSALIRHEMDHVRISTHPFVLAELERVVRSVDSFERRLATAEERDNPPVARWIDEMIEQRVQRLVAFVRFNNQQLDKLTLHGLRALDRRAFFDSLYLSENMRAAGYQPDAK